MYSDFATIRPNTVDRVKRCGGSDYKAELRIFFWVGTNRLPRYVRRFLGPVHEYEVWDSPFLPEWFHIAINLIGKI
jgi:hypothetical protein